MTNAATYICHSTNFLVQNSCTKMFYTYLFFQISILLTRAKLTSRLHTMLITSISKSTYSAVITTSGAWTRVVKWAQNQIANPLSNRVSCEIVFFHNRNFSQSFLQPWLEHIPPQQPSFTFSLGVWDIIVMMMSGDTFLICMRFLYLPQLFIDELTCGFWAYVW